MKHEFEIPPDDDLAGGRFDRVLSHSAFTE